MMSEICARRGLGYRRAPLINLEPCQSDPAILDTMEAAARDQDIPHLTMVSGAGHDSQQIALIAPVAMIFVRSEGGRSHTPEEFSTIDDCTAGIRVLTQALYRLAYGDGS